ncbi:hypothetical protein Mal65_42390 [Crateriforma conspicua]|nr:hypothetical protein Mal65_42390 [Crateriforma conspicua]
MGFRIRNRPFELPWDLILVAFAGERPMMRPVAVKYRQRRTVVVVRAECRCSRSGCKPIALRVPNVDFVRSSIPIPFSTAASASLVTPPSAKCGLVKVVKRFDPARAHSDQRHRKNRRPCRIHIRPGLKIGINRIVASPISAQPVAGSSDIAGRASQCAHRCGLAGLCRIGNRCAY